MPMPQMSLWERWKNRHRHTWEAYRVIKGTGSFWPGFLGKTLMTQIYYRCKGCGKRKFENVEGHWNLDEL